MPYALIEIDLAETPPPVRLGATETGIAIVSRRGGAVVGFSLHARAPGTTLASDEVRALADPEPVVPPQIPAAATGAPSITVAICTHDRTELLRACLGSLLALAEGPYEILVVDNAPSDDGTRALVAETGVRYDSEPCPGLDFARNRALRSARGEVVAFVDDDVLVDTHWLDALRSVWSRHPDAGMVTGQILPVELETDAQIAFERRGGFRGGNVEVRHQGLDRAGDPVYPYNPGMFGAGANMSIRREVAFRLGEFDEALDTGAPLPGGGDIDMMHRILRAGLPLVYDPRAVVFHRHRRDRAGLRRQYHSWGRSLVAFATKTYRLDPAGRPKLRGLVRWFYGYQLRDVARSALARKAAGSRAEAVSAPLAELQGGTSAFFGTYRRSQRRSHRLRREHGRPVVGIVLWGDVVEDYTDALQMSIDDFAERLSGGWLFGFVQAFATAGVDAFIVCWSRAVTEPTRRIHVPTGAVLWVLPASHLYLMARARLADVYAWGLRDSLGRPWVRRALAGGLVARVVAPYSSTTPRALARVMRREGAHAILCQEYEEGRFDLCVALGKRLGIPVFATFQGGDHTRTRVERWVRGRSVRASAGLVVGAESEAARVLRRYRLDPQRVARIANPLDPATVIMRPKREAREALDLAPDARVALWFGRVDVVSKGIDTLVDAWCEVRASCGAPVRLLLLGTGSGAPWLHARLGELGLDDVMWRDEYVLDRAVIGTYLSAADVFVLPSRQEGFPVAPIEAMAAGLPVVAADAPGVRAVVGDGDAAGGIVVAKDDPHAFAIALGRLLDDPQLAATIGARAEQRVSDSFSLEAIGKQLRAFVVDRTG
jgi:glycosyltransferase involved in cell wall biosynthesis/GT2 family glycosyltransferase